MNFNSKFYIYLLTYDKMTLGEFRKLTADLPGDFTIEISVTTGYSKSGIDMETLEDVSVDIGHSSEVVHFFGISPNAEFDKDIGEF